MSAPAFRFELLASDGAARRGRLHSAHGTVETPAFMPVGTAATVKAMTPATLRQTGAEMVLANTYHLMLRPGAERIARLGGLHRFMAWPGPILTDSGGYQVMSLAERRSLDEDGVTFASHLDGSRHRLTPERAVAMQELLDATVTMVLDECTPWPIERAAAEEAKALLCSAIVDGALRQPIPNTAKNERKLNGAILACWSLLHGLTLLLADGLVGPREKCEALCDSLMHALLHGLMDNVPAVPPGTWLALAIPPRTRRPGTSASSFFSQGSG